MGSEHDDDSELRLRIGSDTCRDCSETECYDCEWHPLDLEIGPGEAHIIGVGLAKRYDFSFDKLPPPCIGLEEYHPIADDDYFDQLVRLAPGLRIVDPDLGGVPRRYVIEFDKGLTVDAWQQVPYVVLRSHPLSLAMYEVVAYQLWATVVFVPLNRNQPGVAEVRSELGTSFEDRVRAFDRAAVMMLEEPV